MKTMTEFPGVHMRQALSLFLDATRPSQPKVRPKGEAPAAEAAPVAEAAPAPDAPTVPQDPVIKKRVAPAAVALSPELAEELKSKFNVALKLEGDRLNWMLEAVQILDRRKPKELIRRVVVLSVAEAEKPPQGAQKRGEHFFLVEYLPESILGNQRGNQRGGRQRGDRGRKGGKPRGGRPGGPGRSDRGDRPNRPDRGGEQSLGGRGRGRGRRPERPMGEAVAGSGPRPVIRPVGSSGSAPAGKPVVITPKQSPKIVPTT